jgi:hypothetical protein
VCYIRYIDKQTSSKRARLITMQVLTASVEIPSSATLDSFVETMFDDAVGDLPAIDCENGWFVTYSEYQGDRQSTAVNANGVCFAIATLTHLPDPVAMLTIQALVNWASEQ